jgi:hypothetical protein
MEDEDAVSREADITGMSGMKPAAEILPEHDERSKEM